MWSKLALTFGLALTLTAQTLPVGVAIFGEYNQLGTPRFTGGISAIYPIVSSIGMYGTTTADILPKAAIDPVTGRSFYAFTAAIRQGVHKELLTFGNFKFLMGGDMGPSFSQAQPSGIGLSLSSSFVATVVYQLKPQIFLMAPFRMLYIANVGWNPVTEFGVIIKLR